MQNVHLDERMIETIADKQYILTSSMSSKIFCLKVTFVTVEVLYTGLIIPELYSVIKSSTSRPW